MSVVDKHGDLIVSGQKVRCAGLTGIALEFECDEPLEGVFSGQCTGQLAVDVDGEIEHFPTFASDALDVCHDLEVVK